MNQLERGVFAMWKESYRIGVDLVDYQHMELFRMVKELLDTLEAEGSWESKKEGCKKAISFMKDYVVFHFNAEEEYQESIHYRGLEAHRRQHLDFTKTVNEYERRLIESDFEQSVVRDFAGTLVAWLIYHVADSDQKITRNGELINETAAKEQIDEASSACVGCFSRGVAEVLKTMIGIDPQKLSELDLDREHVTGDVLVEVGLTGDVEGNAAFGFSKAMAFQLIQEMTFMEVEEVDEMVCSALAEIANIVCGNAATELSERGVACDICPPVVTVKEDGKPGGLESKEVRKVSSELGEMEIGLNC